MNAASTIPSASADDDKIENAIVQVDDEIEILDHMLEVTRTADELLRPTNYWSNYQKRILSDLRSNGLRDFRR